MAEDGPKKEGIVEWLERICFGGFMVWVGLFMPFYVARRLQDGRLLYWEGVFWVLQGVVVACAGATYLLRGGGGVKWKWVGGLLLAFYVAGILARMAAQ